MLPVRSYSVRMKRRNRETEASFRKSLYRRRGGPANGSNENTPADSPQTPVRRTFVARTGPLRSSVRSTVSSVGSPVRTSAAVTAASAASTSSPKVVCTPAPKPPGNLSASVRWCTDCFDVDQYAVQ
ncbi:hypothetical protein HPB47_025796 [Ixodes persulcatus]|uniref:Uncharacterized protein n=1 Tax=Ixodes persulcatus TaxID=34615 RepID=A0AC60Q2H5_IXOPE|nr:hypothetical protein HPB47_025796 [Ixodes persulcatus]